MKTSRPLQPLSPERVTQHFHTVDRLRLPIGPDNCHDAVAAWFSDDPEGFYFQLFETDDIMESGLVGRVRRGDSGDVVVGPARIVHCHDPGAIDPGRPVEFSTNGLAQLAEAADLFPLLDGLYRLEGQSALRDPRTGRPTGEHAPEGTDP